MVDKSGKISKDYAEAQIRLAGYRIYSCPKNIQRHPNLLTSPGSPCSGTYFGVSCSSSPNGFGILGSRDRPHSILTGQFPLLEAFGVVEEYTVPASNAAIVIFGRVVGDSFDPRVEGDHF